MDFDHPDIYNLWQVADEVETHRVVLMSTCPGGISAQRVLAAFREVYPGKRDTIELALSRTGRKKLSRTLANGSLFLLVN